MRGKICIFVAALAALLALQGCMRRDAVIFQGISDVEVSMEASPRVGVVLLVENTSGRNITVRDASFVLTSRDGGRIAKARVVESFICRNDAVRSCMCPCSVRSTIP